MARIRTIKPEISAHDGLFDLEVETGFPIRFIWSVLPCHCDREGRFKWNPRRMKPQICPYDELDFSRVLDALWTRGFIEKYEENGGVFGVIPTFNRHQVVNNRESASDLPEPNNINVLACEGRVTHALTAREVQDQEEGKGKEGKGREYVEQAQHVIAYLNKKAETNYQNVDSNYKHIVARIKEGYSGDDFKRVIDSKTAEWISDQKMQKYLRPATLFNAEKFNGYFGQLKTGNGFSELSTAELIQMAIQSGIPNADTMNTPMLINKLSEARQ